MCSRQAAHYPTASLWMVEQLMQTASNAEVPASRSGMSQGPIYRCIDPPCLPVSWQIAQHALDRVGSSHCMQSL